MPQLYGAPAYTRPPRHVEPQRPFDPDELPLEAHRCAADQAFPGADLSALSVEDGAEESDESSFLRRTTLPIGVRANQP